MCVESRRRLADVSHVTHSIQATVQQRPGPLGSPIDSVLSLTSHQVYAMASGPPHPDGRPHGGDIFVETVGDHAELLAKAARQRSGPDPWCQVRTVVNEIYQMASQAILLSYGSSTPRATSATVLVLTEREGYLAHVGLCRAYCFRCGMVVRLTKDDATQAAPATTNTAVPVLGSPQLQALGQRERLHVSGITFKLAPATRLAIISPAVAARLRGEQLLGLCDSFSGIDGFAAGVVTASARAGRPAPFGALVVAVDDDAVVEIPVVPPSRPSAVGLPSASSGAQRSGVMPAVTPPRARAASPAPSAAAALAGSAPAMAARPRSAPPASPPPPPSVPPPPPAMARPPSPARRRSLPPAAMAAARAVAASAASPAAPPAPSAEPAQPPAARALAAVPAVDPAPYPVADGSGTSEDLPADLWPAESGLPQAGFLAALDSADAGRVRIIGVPVTVHPGETLFAQGEGGDRLYVVEEGALEGRNGSVEPSLSGPGDLVGAEAFLTDGRHANTVRATLPSRVLGFRRQDLDALENTDPRLAARFFRQVAAYLARRI